MELRLAKLVFKLPLAAVEGSLKMGVVATERVAVFALNGLGLAEMRKRNFRLPLAVEHRQPENYSKVCSALGNVPALTSRT